MAAKVKKTRVKVFCVSTINVLLDKGEVIYAKTVYSSGFKRAGDGL